MITELFKARVCRSCGKTFVPRYPAEQLHAECKQAWRRLYHRRYKKRQRGYDKAMLPRDEEM